MARAAPDTPPPQRRPDRHKGTSTAGFGAGRRENHDASSFYARFVPPELSTDDTVAPANDPRRTFDRIVCADARQMPELADASAALVVTSPPYFAGKEYEQALGVGGIPATYLGYLQMLEAVFAECTRALEPGGRIAVNVANLGRKPYRSLAGDVTTILQDRLRLLLRGEIVWRKARGASGSCAWGSFRSPSNPTLRDVTERVIVASKGRFDRALPATKRRQLGLPWEATANTDEFMDATLDVWEIPPESATRVGHPAPFPVGLPERLIHLYTYRGDLVVDPFMGGGTSAVAAVRTGRHYAGYDTDRGYVELARTRVADETANCGEQRESFRDRAARVITDAGMTLNSKPPPAGRAQKALLRMLPMTATDRSGKTWAIALAGSFSSSDPGLNRISTAWEIVGMAAAAARTGTELRFAVLSAGAPASGPARTLLAESGIVVIDVSAPDAAEKLRLHVDAARSRPHGADLGAAVAG